MPKVNYGKSAPNLRTLKSNSPGGFDMSFNISLSNPFKQAIDKFNENVIIKRYGMLYK